MSTHEDAFRAWWNKTVAVPGGQSLGSLSYMECFVAGRESLLFPLGHVFAHAAFEEYMANEFPDAGSIDGQLKASTLGHFLAGWDAARSHAAGLVR